MDILWKILATLGLVVLNGYFVAVEFAAVGARQSRLEVSSKTSLLARMALKIKQRLDLSQAAQTGSEVHRLTGHTDTVMSVAFAPDGRRALSGSTDRTLRLWDLETGKAIRTLTGHQGYVLDVSFAPDGRRALSAGADGTLRLWDLETGEELRRLEGGAGPAWAAAFSRDGRWAVSAGNDGVVRLWGSAR